MTNLKKTLAVVLAFAMVLSMGAISTFAAYSDVEDGTAVSEAVTVLSNLSILEGFEDGTFRPEETVTRAQMAAIICRMLGYETQAQSSEGTTVFTDVAGDHWASGYVNVTQAQGIINGYGDGNFGPEDKVTYEQAIKMIVSALGYDIAAARKGGYPTGYLAIASAEGITKRAGGKVNDAAARSTIAVLVYNALDVQLMDQNTWSTDGSDTYGKKAETILTKHHGIYKYRGFLDATPVSLVAGGAYDPDKTPMANLTEAEELIYSANDLPKWSAIGYYDRYDDFVAEDLTAVADKVDTDPYLGKAVVVYAGEDRTTGKNTIYAITEDGAKNTTLKVNATQLVKQGEKYSGYRWDKDANDYVDFEEDYGTIGYREVGSNKIQDIALENSVAVYVNYDGEYYTAYGKDENNDVYGFATQFVANIFAGYGYGGTVEFISNDADSEYEVMLITAYQDEAVVEAVEEEEGVLIYDLYKGGYPEEIDPEDDDVLNVVIKDGEKATVADIAEFDTVSYVEVADDFNMYFVSSKTVEGAVESYEEETNIVTIEGEDYELSAAHKDYGNAKKLADEEGVFFLNVDGQVAHSETDPTAIGNYALVLATYKSNKGVDKGTFLQVVLADGTLAEYRISDTAKLYNADRTIDVENDKDDKEAIYDHYKDLLSENEADTPDLYQANVGDLMDNEDLFVKLTVRNDKITKIRRLEGSRKSETDETKEYDAESMSISNIDFDKNTVVFAVKQKEVDELVEAENIVIGELSSFFSDEAPIRGMVVAADEDEDDSFFSAAIGFGVSKTIDASGKLFVVTGKKTKTIDDYEAYVLSGVVDGDETSITVYNTTDDYITDPEVVTIGDVILLSDVTADGYVNNIEMIVDHDYDKDLKEHDFDVYPSKTAIDDDEVFAGFGEIIVAKDNKFAIDGDIEADYEDAFHDSVDNIAAGTELSYRSSAKFTLVDFAANATRPEVASKKGSKSLINMDNFDSFAYVRYVDGKMAEVVVFRMADYR